MRQYSYTYLAIFDIAISCDASPIVGFHAMGPRMWNDVPPPAVMMKRIQLLHPMYLKN